MKFNKTEINNVYLIKPDIHEDNRGSFIKTFDKNKLRMNFINFDIIQTNLSHNNKKGTLRGMHYQCAPYLEKKIVQCIKGSIYDVILDIRPHSKTYGKWQSFNLTDKNNLILYIPMSVAHGFQTLEDNTTILYYTNVSYREECSKIIKYYDENYNIKWKLPITNISDRDK